MERQAEYLEKDNEKEVNLMMKTNECPECGSGNVHYNEKTNQIFCKDCGAIFEELTPKEEEKFEKAKDQK